MWLTLNLATPAFEKEETRNTFSRLESYSSPKYSFQIRQNAFGYLYQINAFNETSITHLIDGCFHHTWRFRDYCRQLLKTLAKDNEYKQEIDRIKPTLTEKQQSVLDKIL